MILNNRYQVVRVLGSGSFGTTFLVKDTHMPSKRFCVLKRLKPIEDNFEYYQSVQERFKREAVVLEILGNAHEQIPSLYAYFEETGQFFLVQEWIEGQTLAEKLRAEGRLKEDVVREILVSVLSVLDYVHSKQIIHRDIKPENIMLRQQDSKPVLIDFGAVKEAMGKGIHAFDASVSIAIGTMGYMSSEQAAGRPVFSSDLYSLGMTAIRLLTGKFFKDIEVDSNTGQLLWRSHAPEVSEQLAAVLDKAIQSHQRDRYIRAKQMLSALEETEKLVSADELTLKQLTSNLPSSLISVNSNHFNEAVLTINSRSDTKLPLSADVISPEVGSRIKILFSRSYKSAESSIQSFLGSLSLTEIQTSLSNSQKKLLLGGAIVFLGLGGLLGIRSFLYPSREVVTISAGKTLLDTNKESVAKLMKEITSEDKAKELSKQGEDKYQREDYTGAIEDFNEALWLDPNNAQAYNYRGLAYLNLGGTPDTIEDLNEAPSSTPSILTSDSNQGNGFSELGNIQSAIEDFNHSLRLAPNNAQVYNNRGLGYLRLGNIPEAIEDFNQAIEIDPNYAQAYNHRGLARTELDDTKAAIADFNQALQLDSDYAQAYNNRGLVYHSLNDTNAAIADFNQALQLNSDYAQAYNNRGLVHAKLNETKEAIADFEQALRLDPSYTEAYNNRGLARANLGDTEGALKDFNQALEIEPSSVAYNNRGLARVKLGDSEGALKDFNQALEIDPNYAQAFQNLAAVNAQQNNIQSAIADYQKAAELYLQQGETTQYQQSLDEIKKLQ